jgi:cytidyltransferase-like protein
MPPGGGLTSEGRPSLPWWDLAIRQPAQTTVYVDGVFDLFHPGHIAFLKKARAAGGAGARLLVGVITDEDAQWKRRPVMTHAERVTMVRHCTEVGAVIERPPLILTGEFLDEHGVGLVVHGDDSAQEEFFRVPLERGIMTYVPYTAGVSTTALIQRAAAAAPPRP